MQLKDKIKQKIADWQKKKDYDKKIAELKKRDPFTYKNF
jgi:hypothetical protein|tara:strand:+ start:830 stop:946 length:117 start_codon:yes stop_codon:yes gene_type:complete